MRKFDTVIKGGTIIDGLRTPRFVSDIGIADGKIAYIGSIRDAGQAEVIDAAGLIVAPGFIDLHTHYDSQVYWDPYCTISSWHGVTTVVIGNCGFGFAPCYPKDRERSMLTMARNEAVPLETMQQGMPWDWETFPEYLDSLEKTPKGVNIMTYVPLNPLMMYVMGLEAAKSRPANEQERARLRELFIEALDAGACGFSLQYSPGNVQMDYDGTNMISDTMDFNDVALFAEVLRERQEGFIQIICDPVYADKLAEISGRPVIWNALSASADQHGAATLAHRPVIEWLDKANAEGRRIFAQALTVDIAFAFSMEDWNLFDLSPIWREATLGDHDEKIAQFMDPEMRRRMRDEYDRGYGPTAGGGGEHTVLTEEDESERFRLEAVIKDGIETLNIIQTTTGKYDNYCGYTVGELAAELGKHVVDAFLDLAVEENLETQFETKPRKYNVQAMTEVLRAATSIPGTSDGGAHTKFITLGKYPTQVISEMVREHKMIDLEEAHWRLSALPAHASGLTDRGELREGMPADIIVYDFEALTVGPVQIVHDFPGNEWRRIQRADGYRYTIVNGEIIFRDNDCTNAMPGKLLRHGTAEGESYLAMAAE
jgi:N-acyl-D-aspartate/D-glutamate deacylase